MCATSKATNLLNMYAHNSTQRFETHEFKHYTVSLDAVVLTHKLL